MWTDEQVKLLKHLWPVKSASQIAAVLGTTRNAVIGKADRLALQGKPNNWNTRWTEDRDRDLKRLWPRCTMREILAHFGGVFSQGAGKMRARRFGLRKAPDYRRTHTPESRAKMSASHKAMLEARR